MPFSTREVSRGLTTKLGFASDPGQRHPTFVFWREGRVVAKTHISHGAGRKQVSDGIVSAMARQLGVTGPQLRDAIRCAMPPEAFTAILLAQGPGGS